MRNTMTAQETELIEKLNKWAETFKDYGDGLMDPYQDQDEFKADLWDLDIEEPTIVNDWYGFEERKVYLHFKAIDIYVCHRIDFDSYSDPHHDGFEIVKPQQKIVTEYVPVYNDEL